MKAGLHLTSTWAKCNGFQQLKVPAALHTGTGHGFGQFRFNISGLSSGTFTIQASTNLIDWSDIYSDTVPNTNFTDTLPLVPKRNYRVKAP